MLSLYFVLILSASQAQSLERPAIWTTNAERSEVLDKIEKYDWAKSIVDQLHQQVDPKLELHLKDPAAIINEIPAFASSDHQSKEQQAGPIARAHNKVLSLAVHAGILFHLTEE
ncbi:MAG: hypothetical protein AAF705_02550, partial [Bacteroidota bacterium]